MPEPAPAVAEGDGGYVAIWAGLMMLIFVAFVGFAVDVGNWYLQASRLQNASDAAALGGVVYLPDHLPEATQLAERIVGQQGYQNVEVDVARGERPNQLRVTVAREVRNYFVPVLSVLGADLDTTRIERTAVAEFSGPVVMGSPESSIGNDPESDDAQPEFWLAFAGSGTNKLRGDRYGSRVCTGAARCTGPLNDEYANEGYFFQAGVPAAGGAPYRIQLFDPIFTSVGNQCNAAVFPDPTVLAELASISGELAPLAEGDPSAVPPEGGEPEGGAPAGGETEGGEVEATGGQLALVPQGYYADAAERYAGGVTPWCTGDQAEPGADVETTVLVREPDDTDWIDTDNPIVTIDGCAPQTYKAYNPAAGVTIGQLLSPSQGPDDGEWVVDPNDGVITFAEAFRRWVTVCEIPASMVKAGNYLIQVRTNATAAAPTVYDPSVGTSGLNRMSMRVGAAGVDNTVGGAGYTVSAKGRLPIYANANAATTEFFTARVEPASRDRALSLTLYDIGDAASAGTLQVLPPNDSNMPGGMFTGCAFSRDDGVQLASTNDCQIGSVSAANGFDGEIVKVNIPLPAEYNCDFSDPTGCWVKVRVSFPGGVFDTTTWSAIINGDPVRLIE